jgi:hypothetical protein
MDYKNATFSILALPQWFAPASPQTAKRVQTYLKDFLTSANGAFLRQPGCGDKSCSAPIFSPEKLADLNHKSLAR